MTRIHSIISNSNTARISFAISLVVFAFYFIGAIVLGDVYRYAIIGSLYEFLWLPMLLSLIGVPLISVLVCIVDRGKPRVYAVLSVLLTVGSIIIMSTW